MKLIVYLMVLLLALSSVLAVSEFSISGFSEWDSSTVSSFNANITGYPYLLPYTAAEYLFEWNTYDSVGSNNGALSGYTLNNGTISGATTGVSGVYGEGVSLVGNDYITRAYLNEETSISYSYWFKTSDSDVQVHIWNGDNAGAGQKAIFTYTSGTTIFYRLGDGTSYDTLSTTFSYGNWHHIGAYYNGSHAQLCLDDSCSAWTSVGSINPDNEIFIIGADGRTNFYNFNGSLDEIRVFNINGINNTKEMNSHFPVETPILSYSFEAYNATHVFDTNWNTQGQDEAETGAISFDGSQYMTTDSVNVTTFTVSSWAKTEDFVNYQTISSNQKVGTGRTWELAYRGGATDDFFCSVSPNYSTFYSIDTEAYTDGQWHFITCTFNGTTLSIYVDSVLKQSKAASITNAYIPVYYGARAGSSLFWNGSLSEAMVFDRALSADEVKYLYDGSAATYELSTSDGKLETQIPNNSPYTYNISVQATDYFPQSFSQNLGLNLSVYFNQSEISFDSFEKFTNNSLNATYIIVNASGTGITYNEGSQTITDTAGGGTTNRFGMRFQVLTTDIYVTNTTIDSQESGSTRAHLRYLNDTIIETTTTRSGDTYVFATPHLLKKDSIYVIDFDDNGGTYTETYDTTPTVQTFSHWKTVGGRNNGVNISNYYNLAYIGFTAGRVLTETETINLPAANGYQAISQVTDYYNKTFSFDVAALDNKTEDVTDLYNSYGYFSFRSLFANTTVNDVSVNITGSGTTEEATTSNGTYYTGLIKDLEFAIKYLNGTTYIDYNYTFTPTLATYIKYIYLFPFNSLQAYFYDEDTFELLNGTSISVELISDDYGANYTTTTGLLNITLPSPDSYSIRYYATGYTPRIYVFTLEDGTYNILNLTLPKTTYSNISIYVYDGLRYPLEGATVKILKYFPEMSGFVQVGSDVTNYEGRIRAAVEMDTVYYKFIVEYNGDTVLTTSKTFIFDDPVNLYANTLESGFDSLFSITGLYGVITYNETSRTAVFTFDDGDNLASQGCLYAYLITYSSETLVNSSCTVGAAGTTGFILDNVTGTYQLKGYITKDEEDYYITSNYVYVGKTEVFDDNNSLFFVGLLVIVSFFAGFFALEIAVILAGFGLMIMSFTGLLNIGAGYTIPIFALSLVIAYIINRARSNT